MKTFYALVHKDDDSGFGVQFPDAPGCFSAADALADVLANAAEALSLYFEDAPVPDPSDVSAVRARAADDLRAGAFLIAVPLIESAAASSGPTSASTRALSTPSTQPRPRAAYPLGLPGRGRPPRDRGVGRRPTRRRGNRATPVAPRLRPPPSAAPSQTPRCASSSSHSATRATSRSTGTSPATTPSTFSPSDTRGKPGIRTRRACRRPLYGPLDESRLSAHIFAEPDFEVPAKLRQEGLDR